MMVLPRLKQMLTAAAVLTAVAVWPATLYQSNFGQMPDGLATLPDWELGGGTYALEGGWLTVKSGQSNPEALLKASCDQDFTFRATVRNATGVHWSGLLAGGVYRLEVNNQYQSLRLLRLTNEEWKVVASAGPYGRYVANTGSFEIRLVRRTKHLSAFLDSRLLLEYDEEGLTPDGGRFGLLGGWGTNVAWRNVSLTDQPDESQGPRETLPRPLGRKLIEVTQVRGPGAAEPFDSIYFDGQQAGFRVKVKPLVATPTTLRLRFRVIDVHQEEVFAATQEAAFADGAEREISFLFTPPRRGCFKVALDAATAAGDFGWVEDLGTATVVSRELSERPRIANSYFGGHMDAIHLPWHLEAARKLGIQWARCHDTMQWTWWDRVQPDGREQWRWADDYQKQVDGAGFETSGEFLWVPKWAQSANVPAGHNLATYPPASLDDFGRYVFETVSHYKGSIRCWEMWNEPHYAGFFSGTPEQYAQMLQVAYAQAKRAEPTCQIVGGGGISLGSLGWVEKMLAAGGGKSMDAFSFHYLDPDTGPAALERLKQMLASSGFHGPIWDSEENTESSSFLDQCRTDFAEPEARYHFRNACCELVRTYMEALSGGVQRVFFYTLADPWRFGMQAKPRLVEGSQINDNMWEDGETLKPIAAAHAALALAIDGKQFVRRLSKGECQIFIFATADGQSATGVQYAWYPTYARRSEIKLPVSAGVAKRLTVMDFMGNESAAKAPGGALALPLSREPVYLICRGEKAAEALVGLYEKAN